MVRHHSIEGLSPPQVDSASWRTFSKAQFESLIADITAGMDDFSGKLDQMIPAATAAVGHWYMPPDVAEAIMWIARKSVEMGRWLLDLFIDLLKGMSAPIYMFYDSWQWMDVRGQANGIATALTEQHLAVDDSDWSGKAKDAYIGVVAAQSQAATRVGSIASTTSLTLLGCAAAGAGFYTTLAVVRVKLIAAAAAAIAAFGSAVFSWAGAAIILEEAGVNTAIIGTALVSAYRLGCTAAYG